MMKGSSKPMSCSCAISQRQGHLHLNRCSMVWLHVVLSMTISRVCLRRSHDCSYPHQPNLFRSLRNHHHTAVTTAVSSSATIASSNNSATVGSGIALRLYSFFHRDIIYIDLKYVSLFYAPFCQLKLHRSQTPRRPSRRMPPSCSPTSPTHEQGARSSCSPGCRRRAAGQRAHGKCGKTCPATCNSCRPWRTRPSSPQP